jgi:hypothetical protein
MFLGLTHPQFCAHSLWFQPKFRTMYNCMPYHAISIASKRKSETEICFKVSHHEI